MFVYIYMHALVYIKYSLCKRNGKRLTIPRSEKVKICDRLI